MTSGNHVSVVSSARFEGAITRSLAELESTGRRFCVSDVVRNARYDDGSAVGETTIYARSNGKRVHEKLLATIKDRCARSRTPKKREPSCPGDGAVALAEGGGALHKQLIEQESRIQELESTVSSVSHRLRQADEELYVVLTTLSLLTQGALLDAVRAKRELEAALSDRTLLSKLNDEAGALADQARRLMPRRRI